MTEAITKPDADAIERVLVTGDLAALTPAQRVEYYSRVCTSLGLNPLTKPFAYIVLNGKLTLYALRDCADQLRKIHGVSIDLADAVMHGDVFVVKAKATDRTGRTDASNGAVSIKGLAGEALANALMKAETKAKRRVTLSICGLGMLDETEVETVADRRAGPAVEVPAAPQRRSAAPAPALTAPVPSEAPDPEPPSQRRPPAPEAPTAPQNAFPSLLATGAPAGLRPLAEILPAIDAEEVPFSEDPRPAPVRVERAKLIKAGGTEPNTWKLYGFKFSDGVECTSFDSKFFEIAIDAASCDGGVRYETQPGKKPGTLSLASIERA
jgi:hypothetical protein